MARNACLSFLLLILSACNAPGKTRNTTPPRFQSFEISYTDGWTKTFSLLVDTNRIYLSPHKWDTAYYGILPDTIYKLFEATFLEIEGSKSVRSKNGGCVDCPLLAIKIIAHGDTLRIRQTGRLDSLFHPLISRLQTFLDSSKHQTTEAILLLETQSVVTPPPPPIREQD